MNEQKKEHDKLAVRLTQILIKLNNGEKLEPKKLAEEFNVSLRTIQRDISDRFNYLPLKNEQGLFSLEPYYLGKLNQNDIKRFSSLAGINGLFPGLKSDFIREIFDTHIQQAYLVKGHHYEDLSSKTGAFKQLEQAILTQNEINFQYKTKTYTKVQPYKLVNHKGIWYLAAQDKTKLKTFCFSQVESLVVNHEIFKRDPAINARIEQEDSIWFGEKREVVLKVDSSVAHYFKRRSLIPNQHIDKELEDNSLIISTLITHDNQILPIIRYWMPNISVISPNDLREALFESLREYINNK